MTRKTIPEDAVQRFRTHLINSGRAPSTAEKYCRSAERFLQFTGGRFPAPEQLVAYRAELGKKHSPTGANTLIAAVNSFLRFAGKGEEKIKPLRIQKKVCNPEERELTKEEYLRLVRTASRRLSLLLQTVCSTGIRISELPFITVEAAKEGEANVACKGKNRQIFIVPLLQKKLLRYAAHSGIRSGPIFITKSGNPLNRSNIWKEMKKLCSRAGVAPEKVFPHNLRHLFARTFYGIEKDIAKLADILGHSDVNTTRIYIRTTAREHRRRMERLHLIL